MPAIAIPAAMAIGGGVIGQAQASGDRNRANQAYANALAQLSGVYVPSIEEQKVAYQTPGLVGTYNPLLEQSPDQMATEMAGVSTDPRLQQAQMDYLQRLGQMGETGMTMEDRAALDQIQRQTQAQQQSQQNAILQNMAQRGTLGSGMELAARLNASQQAADSASQQGLQVAAQAQKRGLEALAQAGGLSGQMRGQEFNEKSDIAKAQDVIGQFNLQNALQTNRGNVAEQRAAQQRNLAAQQAAAEQTAQIRNQQEQQNKALYQTRFANEMGKSGAMAGAYNTAGQQAQQQAQATAQNWANMGTGASSAMLAGMGAKKPKETT